MPNATDEPAPAEVAYADEWRIQPADSTDKVTSALRYAPSASNCSAPMAPAAIGLLSEALRGCGAFRFHPDSSYAKPIASFGLTPFPLRKQIVAGLFDIPTSFVKAVLSTGIPHVTFSDLLKLKIFRVTADDVAALHAESGRRH